MLNYKNRLLLRIYMEELKAILPLIGVIVGWLLSEGGKILADRKQDKRRIKKMLYFLLELRFHFSREFLFEMQFDKFLKLLSKRLIDEKLMDSKGYNNKDFAYIKNVIKELNQKNFLQDSKITFLLENIDKIIVELAEVLPILAYELSGKHNIKDRLNKVDNYFSEMEKTLGEEIPIDVKEWINPKMTKDLLNDLDESIEDLSKRINRKTKKTVLNKISEMENNNEKNEMIKFINDYVEQIKISLNNNTKN